MSSEPVLLVGETGVGKEVFARAVHAGSSRRDKPLVRINCAAIPAGMLESELFGFERGAFTGAAQPKPGLFEMADGGTVFLDELGELPLSLQAKLLGVLETGEVQRLGAIKPRALDVRWVSATNRDLRRSIATGEFRADLCHRLDGVTASGERTPRETMAAATDGGLREALDAVEKQRVLDALEKCGNNQSRAAKLLGISRHALIARIERFELTRPRKR